MSTAVSALEIQSLTSWQKTIFWDEAEGSANEGTKGKRTTPFYNDFRACTWYSSVPARMPGTEDSDDMCFAPNTTFHYLTHSDLRQHLPAIRVLPRYKDLVEICWPHNIGTATIDWAELRVNDKIFQRFDRVWCDFYFQFNMKPGFREAHSLAIGSIPKLENWSSSLPAYTTNVQLPWWYSEDLALAFPLHYCSHSSNIRVEHRFRFIRRIGDILRMRTRRSVDDPWVEGRVNFACLEGVSSTSKFLTPELWGRYHVVTNCELVWQRTEGNSKFYIKDVIEADATNPCSFNNGADIELRCGSPCVALFWAAENYDALQKKITSNYTTNTHDLYSGYDPILTTSLKYTGIDKFRDMHSDHFNLGESRKFFLSPPNETGYHAFSFGTQPFGYDPDVAPVFSQLRAILSMRIADTDIFKIPMENDERDLLASSDALAVEPVVPEYSRFIPRVRMLVLKEYTVTTTETGQVIFDIK